MNLQDQVVYRCIDPACARTLARKVNFCPYCGAGQQEGAAVRVGAPAREAELIYRAPPYAPVRPLPAAQAEPVFAAPGPQPAAATPAAAPPPPASKAAPRFSAAAAAPPQPKPIRLRYWLMALALLAAIWFYAKPASKRFEARIADAIALGKECKMAEAQAELIALRQDKATPEQLARLQAALNSAGPVCDKKKARARTWSETVAAVESALDEGDPARAQVRLAQFTKRHGDDADTRALKARIAAQRDAEAPPRKTAPITAPIMAPIPAPITAPVKSMPPLQSSAAAQAQSSRNLISEAERELALGNYKAASDKLETCISMIEGEGSRECVAYKAHADRMLRDMQRCVAGGRQWSNGRCS